MSFVNVASILNSNYALAIVFAILALETGLPLVIGLPGDTLLITAGLFAAGVGVHGQNGSSGHHISIVVVAIGSPIFGFIGSQFGHWFGGRYGTRLFSRESSRFFNAEKIRSAERYMVKYGVGKAIILGRFIPVVRGLINPLAGMVRVPVGEFTKWNLIGSLVWTQSFIWGGYVIGNTFADTISKYLTYIILTIAGVTIIPLALEIFKEWRSRKHLS